MVKFAGNLMRYPQISEISRKNGINIFTEILENSSKYQKVPLKILPYVSGKVHSR